MVEISEFLRHYILGEQTTEVVILQDQGGSQCLYINGKKEHNGEEYLFASELVDIVGEGVKCTLDYRSYKMMFAGNPPDDLDEAEEAGLID